VIQIESSKIPHFYYTGKKKEYKETTQLTLQAYISHEAWKRHFCEHWFCCRRKKKAGMNNNGFCALLWGKKRWLASENINQEKNYNWLANVCFSWLWQSLIKHIISFSPYKKPLSKIGIILLPLLNKEIGVPGVQGTSPGSRTTSDVPGFGHECPWSLPTFPFYTHNIHVFICLLEN